MQFSSLVQSNESFGGIFPKKVRPVAVAAVAKGALLSALSDKFHLNTIATTTQLLYLLRLSPIDDEVSFQRMHSPREEELNQVWLACVACN